MLSVSHTHSSNGGRTRWIGKCRTRSRTWTWWFLLLLWTTISTSFSARTCFGKRRLHVSFRFISPSLCLSHSLTHFGWLFRSTPDYLTPDNKFPVKGFDSNSVDLVSGNVHISFLHLCSYFYIFFFHFLFQEEEDGPCPKSPEKKPSTSKGKRCRMGKN